ncbi:MAG: SRPBCC domain-containing protein [Microscillaceae bacterium]|nr:SRPBCC domain-containing protein [Microscillaceae bacterium]
MLHPTQIIAEEGQHTIFIERKFDARPEQLFTLFTEADLFIQWSKPDNTTLEVKSMNCQTGGSFLWHHIHANGSRFSFYGVYHEVLSPKSIIRTSEFRGLPDKLLPVLEVLQFEPMQDQQTKLSITIYCPHEAYRDSMLNSGMQAHFDHSFALLDTLLKSFN